MQDISLWALCSLKNLYKGLEPVLAALRAAGTCLVAYIDVFLILGGTKEEAEAAIQGTKNLLQTLGFVINLEKSQSEAT